MGTIASRGVHFAVRTYSPHRNILWANLANSLLSSLNLLVNKPVPLGVQEEVQLTLIKWRMCQNVRGNALL